MCQTCWGDFQPAWGSYLLSSGWDCALPFVTPESGLSATSGKSCSASGKLHSLELGPHTSGTGLHNHSVCYMSITRAKGAYICYDTTSGHTIKTPGSSSLGCSMRYCDWGIPHYPIRNGHNHWIINSIMQSNIWRLGSRVAITAKAFTCPWMPSDVECWLFGAITVSPRPLSPHLSYHWQEKLLWQCHITPHCQTDALLPYQDQYMGLCFWS